MWRCCICPLRQFPSVQEYAMHVDEWHGEWLAGNRIPPGPVVPLPDSYFEGRYGIYLG